MGEAASVDGLRDGDHACLTFSDPDEHLDILAAFVAEGLDFGHRVICLTDTVPPDRLPAELAVREVSTAGPMRRGQLTVRASDQLWRADQPAGSGVVGFLAGELDRAVEQGYPGLRVTVDMCWATRPAAAVDQLTAFESAVAALFADGRLTAICQYDRTSFDPVTLAFAADTHGKVVAAVAYHDDPLVRICRQHRPAGVRIAGELDYTRLDPLQQALSEALRLDQDIHVNLSRLRFIDVPCAAAIAKAALSLPHGRRMIVTCRPPVSAVFSLVGADEAAQFQVQRAP
jgi:anti-anti-sigma regulatory factor